MRLFRRNKGTLMITGASGFLGRHLMSHREQGWQVFAPPHSSLDVCNLERVRHEMRSWEPDVVVHLAYRRDDRRAIVDGSRNVASAAAAAGARLIHLSTDVVFAGRDTPYTEIDVPDATMDYGKWKAEAELEVHRAHPNAVMVRTSLLYGTDQLSPGQHAVTEALTGGQPTTYFTDEYRCPVHAADVADALIRLAEMPEVDGPLHVAGPQVLSRAELAAAFARHLSLDETRLLTTTLAESGQHRPARVVLDTSKAAALGITCRSVEEALRRPTV
ncbi:MAG: sugar nucleotide-binding protein [Actinobacteria bacterium]|nr:sugar nucleotide-binding protein [Actinomycetota bacterium]